MIVKWVYFFVTHAHKRWWSQKRGWSQKKRVVTKKVATTKKVVVTKKGGNHKQVLITKKRWQSQKKWRSQKTEVFTFLTIVLHLLLPSIILNLQENSSKFSNNFRISLIIWYFMVLRILINESFLIKIFSLWIESFRGTASVFLRPHVSKLSLAATFFFSSISDQIIWQLLFPRPSSYCFHDDYNYDVDDWWPLAFQWHRSSEWLPAPRWPDLDLDFF